MTTAGERALAAYSGKALSNSMILNKCLVHLRAMCGSSTGPTDERSEVRNVVELWIPVHARVEALKSGKIPLAWLHCMRRILIPSCEFSVES